MTDDNEIINFVGEQFRRLNVRFDNVEADVRELKHRQTVVDHRLAGIMASLQLVNERVDRIGEDVRLIKRRLDLVDAE